MRKAILLLISGMLILSLSGMAFASATVLIPDDVISVPVGETKDVVVKIQELHVGEEYTLKLLVPSNVDIEASIQNDVTNKINMPVPITDPWASYGHYLSKTFTYTDPIDATLKIKRVSGDETGMVTVAVYSGTTIVGVDSVSSESIDVTVPEFPTIALPVAAILGLVFVFGRKKEEL